jgi:arylsulfatase A-like enzyme
LATHTCKTPHLDALSRDGMRLTQFYVMSPVCSPSRAALITGRFAAETGVHYAIGGEAGIRYNSVPWLDPELPTVYDAFGCCWLCDRSFWQVAHWAARTGR